MVRRAQYTIRTWHGLLRDESVPPSSCCRFETPQVMSYVCMSGIVTLIYKMAVQSPVVGPVVMSEIDKITPRALATGRSGC